MPTETETTIPAELDYYDDVAALREASEYLFTRPLKAKQIMRTAILSIRRGEFLPGDVLDNLLLIHNQGLPVEREAIEACAKVIAENIRNREAREEGAR